ncbi:MAG: 4-carboxymuconolactone decarboxylase [Mycobacterium sp.]|nr:4-carboxymuconolactone decarboxylase [Mycobacterium sp.]
MKLTNQDAIAELDPDFATMAVEVGRHAWGLSELTMREKAFVFLAADLCTRCLGFPLQTHVQMALSQGVSVTALREAVRHLAPYAGYPTAAEALMTLAELEEPEEETSATPAAESTVTIDEVTLTRLAHLDDRFAAFYRAQFHQRWGRCELSVRERALATIATDVLNGTLDDSLRLHVSIALNHGAAEEQIRAVVLQVAEFAVAKAWRAFDALTEILATSTA